MSEESLARLVRYVIVGVVTLLAYLGVGHLLAELGMATMYLGPIAFLAAVATNYVLQRNTVFLDQRPVIVTLPKFMVMGLVGFVLNSGVLMVTSSMMPLVWSQILAASFIVTSNMLLAFFWVFASAEKSQTRP